MSFITSPTADVREIWPSFQWRVDRNAVPSLVCLGAIAVMFAAAFAASGLGFDSRLAPLFLSAATLWWGGSRLNRAGAQRFGGFLQTLGVFVAFAVLVPLTSAALATSNQPYADTTLIAADEALFFGFTWPWMVGWLHHYSGLLLALSHAYASIEWQPLVLLGLLCASGRTRAAWVFMTAWGLTLCACLVVFPWCPAVGAYVHYALAPHDMPGVRVPSAWDAAKIMESFRGGAVRVIDTRALEGIITMPSFHAASAVMFAWGFSAIRQIAPPFAALNALMLVSSVPIGGHYLVDVMAGSLLAVGAIVAAVRIHRALETTAEPRRETMSPAMLASGR